MEDSTGQRDKWKEPESLNDCVILRNIFLGVSVKVLLDEINI